MLSAHSCFHCVHIDSEICSICLGKFEVSVKCL